MIQTWSNFSSLEQAIEIAKQQTGRAYVLEDEKVVWENEEAIAWKYPKEITCHLYKKEEIYKTQLPGHIWRFELKPQLTKH